MRTEKYKALKLTTGEIAMLALVMVHKYSQQSSMTAQDMRSDLVVNTYAGM
jgi:hypothetical protein